MERREEPGETSVKRREKLVRPGHVAQQAGDSYLILLLMASNGNCLVFFFNVFRIHCGQS